MKGFFEHPGPELWQAVRIANERNWAGSSPQINKECPAKTALGTSLYAQKLYMPQKPPLRSFTKARE
jgi:hypothetical protein